MSTPTHQCPRCAAPCHGMYEEVDIGVGVQRHFVGWECDACEEYTTACNTCGVAVLGDVAHKSWCSELASMKLA